MRRREDRSLCAEVWCPVCGAEPAQPCWWVVPGPTSEPEPEGARPLFHAGRAELAAELAAWCASIPEG